MLQPSGPLTIFTPLGIRFWDPVRDTQVSDNLKVTARPLGRLGPVTTASRTASGVYAFNGLAGLHDIEFPKGNTVFERSPPEAKRFVVEVSDRLRRFLPLAFCVDLPLPYKGVLFNGVGCETILSGRPPTWLKMDRPPGLCLFSAPTRAASPGLAVVRATLVEGKTGKSASHVVLEVKVKQGKRWFGVADARGCIAVIFPYPKFAAQLSLSPPATHQIPLYEHQWDVEIRVRYSPYSLTFPPHSKMPDLRSVLNQSPGIVCTTWPGSPVAESYEDSLSTALTFGQELILQTKGLFETELWIDTVTSPP